MYKSNDTGTYIYIWQCNIKKEYLDLHKAYKNIISVTKIGENINLSLLPLHGPPNTTV